MEEKVIQVDRFAYNNNTTFGKLYIDDVFFCYTLEDTLRANNVKVKSHTCIPAETVGYEVGFRYSPGFKRDMVIMYNQSDKETIRKGNVEFKYVYFHGGNTHENTDGCILVAANISIKDNKIWGTKEKELKDIIETSIKDGVDVIVKIKNLPQDN